MARSLSPIWLPTVAATVCLLTPGCFGQSTAGAPDGGSLSEQGTAFLTSSPSSESFGTVAVGAQSASATVTILNGGAVPASALSTSVSAGDFAIDADGCSGTSLAAGAACTMKLHFAPRSTGAQSGMLTVMGAGTTPLAVGLSGTGSSASSGSVSLAVTPGTKDFGTVGVGATSSAVSFTVSNGGTETSGAIALALTGQDAADYAVGSDTCTGKTLAAGASCAVGVTFAPTSAGAATATLTASAAGSSAVATASLSGNAASTANLSVAPASYDFGSIVEGTATAQQAFTVTNTGGVASGVVAVTLAGTNAADFALASNGCTAAVPAGGACMFALTFTPSSAGAESASVTVSAPSLQLATTAVTGTGLAPAAIAFAPTSQGFGTLAQGITGTDVAFVVTNGGGVATGPLKVSLGGSDSDQFGLGADGCTGQLLAAGGGTCTVNAHFAPTASGTLGNLQASLQVTGSPGGTSSATLTGTSVLPATLVLSTTAQAFGSVAQGQSSGAVPVTVTNVGGVASGTLTAALSGTNANEYVVGADSCSGQTLAAAATCTVNIVFMPGSGILGMQQASLTVSATPGGSPSATLTGTAVPPAALSVSPPAQSWGDVVQDAASNAVTLTVVNGGGVTSGTLAVALGGADDGQFTIVTDQCSGQMLLAGGVCLLGVTFTPTLGTLGAQQATLTVSGSPGGSVPVSLVGNATTPLGVAPGSQNLGIAAFGSASAPLAFTVTNSSAVALGPLSVTFQGADGPQFQVGANSTCGGTTLLAKGTCTVNVLLSPTSGTTGSMQGALAVSAGVDTVGVATLTGTAVKAATLGFASNTQSFDIVVQGQSSGDVPLTVTNSGGVATGMLTASLSGTAAQVAQFGLDADTCTGKTVAAGSSCVVDVHFAPGATVLGLQQATLTVSGTPGGAPTVALSGTAVTQAGIQLTPSSESFATTVQGSATADTVFTATNGGGVATGALSVAITGAQSGQFEISSDTCTGKPLPPNSAGSCAVKAHFAPTLGTLGVQQATLTVTGVPGGTAPSTLIGTATSPLGISPSSEPFPNAAYQSPSGSVPFTVTNTSTSAVGPLTVALGGANANQYELASGGTCAGATLGGGTSATCVVNVAFAPGQGVTGTELATLTVAAGGANTSVQAALSGTAVTPAALTLTGSGTFPSTLQGTASSDVGFTVKNTGGAASGTISVTLGGADPTQFGLGTSTCPSSLGAGASCTINVHFSPGATVTGLQQATLTASAAPGGAPAVPLSGTAVTSAALSIAGNGAFGAIVQGSKSSVATFTVTNTGGVTSGTLSVSALGAGFAIGTDGCTGHTLAPNSGTSCTVTADFAPSVSTLGNQSTTLTVVGTPGGSAHAALTGTATTALTLSASSFTFGTVAYATTSVSNPFTVTNISTSSVGPLNVGLQGSNPGQFGDATQKPPCSGATLAAGGSCVVYADFAPTQGTLGVQSAILDVNAGASTDVQASLTGTAATPATLGLTVPSPFTGSFGLQQVNTTSTPVTFTLHNTGGVPSGSVELATNDSDFVVSNNTCNVTALAAGGSCTFSVAFAPTYVSTPNGESTTLQATASPGGTAPFALSGIGRPTTVTLTIEWVNGPACADSFYDVVSFTPADTPSPSIDPPGECMSNYGTCTVPFNYGAAVNVTQVTSDGTFVNWAGACGGVGACSPIMTSNQTLVVDYCGGLE